MIYFVVLFYVKYVDPKCSTWSFIYVRIHEGRLKAQTQNKAAAS